MKDDKYDLDLHEIVRLLREEHGIDNAYLEMTGGNTATIFAGPTRPHPEYPGEDFKQYAAIAGPGNYGAGEGTLYDFVVGVDDQGETDAVTPLEVGAVTEADVAKIIAAQARKDFEPLSFDDIEAIGFDGSGRSTPSDAAWEQARTDVWVAAYNVKNRELAEKKMPYDEERRSACEAAGRAAAEEWEKHNPMPESPLRQYEVTLANTFDAESPEDAVGQMAGWAAEAAYVAGYRVTDQATGQSWFIDAEDLRKELQ